MSGRILTSSESRTVVDDFNPWWRRVSGSENISEIIGESLS